MTDKEADFLCYTQGTRLCPCPCGCAFLIGPGDPGGPFLCWVQGCEEERQLYKANVVESTVYIHRDGRVLLPEPVELCHVRALHHDHLREALIGLECGLERWTESIYYPLDGLPADWHDRLGWRIDDGTDATPDPSSM